MHAFAGGAIKEILKVFIRDDLTPTQRSDFDNLAKNFHKTHRQTYRDCYPKTSFSNGVTNVTKITCGENVGLVFLIVCLSHFKAGKEMFEKQLDKHGITNFGEVLETLEALLCFNAWIKMPKQWKLDHRKDAVESAQESIKTILQQLLDRLPPAGGNGWNIPKFHELLHLIQDMIRFGAALNFCAQHCEGFLKTTEKRWAKEPKSDIQDPSLKHNPLVATQIPVWCKN